MKCNQRLFFLPKTKESAIILIIMEKSTEICTGKLSKVGFTFHTMGRQKDYSLVELLRKQTGPQKDFFEAQKTLTDTNACITQSKNITICTRVMHENFFSTIFFFTISILMDFRYFVTLRFYGTVFESSGLGSCYFRLDTLYIGLYHNPFLC